MNKSSNQFNTRKMATSALLVALILILSFTPLGYLRIGPLAITFITIPVIVGAIMLGPFHGALLGATFGLTSFAQCFMGDPFGATLVGISIVNTAILCLVPRILMGYLSAVIFGAMGKKSKEGSIVPFALTSLCGALLNTVLFMGSLMLLFGNTEYILGLRGGANIFAFLVAFVGINGLVEAGVATVIGASVSRALFRVINK